MAESLGSYVIKHNGESADIQALKNILLRYYN